MVETVEYESSFVRNASPIADIYSPLMILMVRDAPSADPLTTWKNFTPSIGCRASA
jgi:hypothetical protein